MFEKVDAYLCSKSNGYATISCVIYAAWKGWFMDRTSLGYRGEPNNFKRTLNCAIDEWYCCREKVDGS